MDNPNVRYGTWQPDITDQGLFMDKEENLYFAEIKGGATLKKFVAGDGDVEGEMEVDYAPIGKGLEQLTEAQLGVVWEEVKWLGKTEAKDPPTASSAN